jgi:hypothetical protein
MNWYGDALKDDLRRAHAALVRRALPEQIFGGGK